MEVDPLDSDSEIKRSPVTVADWLKCGVSQESAEILAGKRRSNACHGFAGGEGPLLYEEYDHYFIGRII